MLRKRMCIATLTAILLISGLTIVNGNSSQGTKPKKKSIHKKAKEIKQIKNVNKIKENDKTDINKEMEIARFEAVKEAKQNEVVTRGGGKVEEYEVIKLTVTAYAPFDNKSGMCSDGNPSKTYSGTKPKHGTISANLNRFPIGTKMYIEGYGEGTVLDTGGAMRRNSNKLDIYMDTYDEAIQWGKREIEVKVYK